jgi:hypothetical protein
MISSLAACASETFVHSTRAQALVLSLLSCWWELER